MQVILKGDTMIEREYKFLVNKLPDKICDEKIYIVQYYFDIKKIIAILPNYLKLNKNQLKDIHSVRLRVSKSLETTNYILNAKTNGLFVRQEYECEISKQIAKYLLQNFSHFEKIVKERNIYLIDNLKFEFDVYKNKNLIVCEVEVEDEQKYKNILDILTNKLNLKVKDVTFDEKYKNYNLIKENLYEWNNRYNKMVLL